MAETAVSFVLEQFVSLLASEARLFTGLPRNLVAINNQLKTMKVFLKDAEKRAEEDDVIKEWVRQVRDIAYQIEDVNDEFLILHKRPDNQAHHRFNLLHKLNQFVAYMKLGHRLATTIKGIQSEILEINNRRTLFMLDRTPSSLYGPQVVDALMSTQDPRAGFHYVDESELVGIEEPKRDLIRMLDLELRELTQCKVISVVGMGGLGKTTLVRKVYEDVSVRKHFPFRAWITHSRPEKSVSIIRSMVKQFRKAARDSISPEIDSMDEELLIEELRSYLHEKRFLVVFDDVWSIETYFKDLLPTNSKGSKIVLTTRHENVALAWKDSSYYHLYMLQPLSPPKAWNLFCKKAFQDPEATCPPQLEKLSLEIVKKCEGLPLAIVTIGGLLSTKDKTIKEWQKLCNSIGAELANNSHLASIKKILLLSYYDLPHLLKPCFLYMGIFPSDRSIEFQRLTRLWMAEGFIPTTPGKTLEAVANEYLMELIRRSLVQVIWFDVTSRPRNLRVHDLLREIIRLKSDDLCFFRVLNSENFNLQTQSRRLVVTKNNEEGTSTKLIDEGNSRKPRVRSLFLFVGREAMTNILTESFLRSVRLLKVLDLQNAPIQQIPEATGDLCHLKYLSLKGSKVVKLPRSIGKLCNLLTLDLKGSPLQEIPFEISRMPKLRNLLSYSYNWDDTFSFYLRKVTAAKVPIAVCKSCPELQNLGWIDVSHSDSFIKQLGNLKQLRRLGVAELTGEDGKNLCNAINNMHCLEEFLIASRNNDELLDIDYISSPPRLCRLLLMGRLRWLPEWISGLENIVKLVLCHSKLKDDPLEVLGALPNLVKLILSEAYDGEQMFVGASRFQKLKVLRLYNLYNLKSLNITQGALPVLKELELGPSPLMEKVPICIKHLSKLTLLRFHDMPKKFSESMCPNKGDLYQIIEHVPNVYINYKAGAGHWVTYSLRHPQDKEMVVYKTGADYHIMKRGTAWAPIRHCSHV